MRKYLAANPINNVHFIEVVVPNTKWTRFLAWIRKENYQYGSYIQYKNWHRYVLKEAKHLIDKENISLIHYLNPIGFKEPSKLWKIKGIPYVWGPMQGVENRPFCLYKAMGLKGRIDALARFVLHNGIMLLSPNIRKAIKRSDVVFAATPNTVKQVRAIFRKETIYLPENGITEMRRKAPICYNKGERLKIIWIGAICERKGLRLLLQSLRIAHSREWELHIVGDGSLSASLKKEYIDLREQIIWHGAVTRDEVQEILSKSHLHVISSLGEVTTTVLFEAMSWGIPTMTLDHCGMSGVVCEKCGIKIPINSFDQVLTDMASNIETLILKPEKIGILSMGVIECAKKYAWSRRVEVFNSTYSQLVK